VKKFLPESVTGQMNQIFEVLPVNTIKTLGNASSNLNDDLTPKNSADYCGYPLF
jgi:hypothetical protein